MNLIVVRVDGLELYGLGEEPTRVLTLDDEIGVVVEELTRAFGADPALAERPANNDSSAAKTDDWSGLRLVDGLGVTGDATSPTNYRVIVEGNAVGPVSIETVEGIRVGDDGEAVETMLGVAPDRMSCWGPAAEYGPGQGESLTAGEPLAYGVEVGISQETGLVRSIVTPQLYGAGCA